MTEQFECNSCGAHLEFDPKTQHMKCDYCESEEIIKIEHKAIVEHDFYSAPRATGWERPTISFQCESCGATISSERKIAGKCTYCNSPYVKERAPRKDLIRPETLVPFKVDKKKVKKIISDVQKDNRRVLLGSEAHEIAEAYGIPVASIRLATSSEEAKNLANELGYPVVLKIASPDIVHKSDIGGIQIGLKTQEEVESGFLQILENAKTHMPKATIYGVDVQEMAEKGKELIIGCSRDVQFGPLIMFGAGGIFVDYIKDISFKLAPMTRLDASELIMETKMGALLKGVRGEPPSDIAAIEDTILKISQLVTDFEEVVELDINPAFAYEKGKGVSAVDVKITISG